MKFTIELVDQGLGEGQRRLETGDDEAVRAGVHLHPHRRREIDPAAAAADALVQDARIVELLVGEEVPHEVGDRAGVRVDERERLRALGYEE